MPMYKTHAIMSDKSNNYIDKRIDLNVEDLKTFSFGPDSLIYTDPILFNTQHNRNSKLFFECLIKSIKHNKQLDNSELISFLYGQLSHFILDYNFHPYIYYLSSDLKTSRIIGPHVQIELWLDSYIMNKYGINSKNYLNKDSIKNKKAKQIIDDVYYKIFRSLFTSNKYNIGFKITNSLEKDLRRDKKLNLLLQRCNVGDFNYYDDNMIIDYFLNCERARWTHPVSGVSHNESIDELWNNSVADYIEAIECVNKYLYDDKELDVRLLHDNVSYDTSMEHDTPRRFVYTKKY